MLALEINQSSDFPAVNPAFYPVHAVAASRAAPRSIGPATISLQQRTEKGRSLAAN